MRIWGGTLLGALACLLAGGSLATAAEPSFEVRERRLSTLMEVEASNGYLALIGTDGHKRVTLILLKGTTMVVARTSGRVTREEIQARFGDLGSVSVRFQPNAVGKGGGLLGLIGEINQRRVRSPRCHGREPVSEGGAFRGRIEFHGENGFTRIDSRHAPGLVERRYRQVCRRVPKKDFTAGLGKIVGKLRFTVLQAQGRNNGVRVFFKASALDVNPLSGKDAGIAAEFSALTVEHREGMLLARKVSAKSDEGAFIFGKKAATTQTATISARKPFSGAAQYLAARNAPVSWAGTLAARLPGAGLIAMTGPRFRADLCHLTFAAKLDGEGCFQGGRPPLGLLSNRRSRRRAGEDDATYAVAGPGAASSGQRLPVPGLLGGQALLVEIAAELR